LREKIFRNQKKRGRIAVFISGRGSNFKAIHDAVLKKKINAEISLVLSNKKDAPGLKIAQKRNLDTIFLDPKDFGSNEEYDREIIKKINKKGVDLICLAGYMKILTPLLCREYNNRIMNIHPALLPAFPGLHVQRKAIDWGVRYSGVTVHFVTSNIDMGPIILQAVVPVFQDDSEKTLSERILKEEHKIYPEAVRLFFEGRLELRGRRVYIKK